MRIAKPKSAAKRNEAPTACPPSEPANNGPSKEALAKEVKALAIQKGRTAAQQRYFERARTRYCCYSPCVRHGLHEAAQTVRDILAANNGVATTAALEQATSACGPYALTEVRRDMGLIAVKLGKVWYTVDVEPPPPPPTPNLARAG